MTAGSHSAGVRLPSSPELIHPEGNAKAQQDDSAQYAQEAKQHKPQNMSIFVTVQHKRNEQHADAYQKNRQKLIDWFW